MSSEEFCDPLDKNQPTIRLVSQFPILFSILGSLFIIFIYTCYKETRNFAYKLILQISIADFIYCFAHFFGESASVYIPISSGWLCSIQAYLVNFGMEASFMWSMVVAWTLYSTVVLSRLDIQKKFWIYAVYGYLIPLVASAVPFITGNYGPVGYRCWITINNNPVAGNILRFALLYVPLWIVIIFNTLAYYKVIKFLKVYVSGGPDKRFVRRLRAYPMILVICWLGVTIRSIYTLFGCESDYNFLDIISIVLPDLNGFFNALAYGLNHHVQAVLVKKCPCLLIFRRCCWCCSCCYWASQSQKVAPIAGHERLIDSEMSEIELSMYSE